MKKREKSVGLIALIHIKDFGWTAILRRRGWFSKERMAPQYFSGACQVTVHGKCENGEDEIPALRREMTEELGEKFCNQLDLPTIQDRLIEVNREKTEEKIITTYGIILPFYMVLIIQLNNPFDRLEMLTRKQAFAGHIRKVNKGDKEKGIQNMNKIFMFPDEKKAVLSAFEKLT